MRPLDRADHPGHRGDEDGLGRGVAGAAGLRRRHRPDPRPRPGGASPRRRGPRSSGRPATGGSEPSSPTSPRSSRCARWPSARGSSARLTGCTCSSITPASAPVGRSDHPESSDGFELRFAVNYLAGFVLTLRLLPLLRRSAPARIVNVASLGQAPLDFDDPMLERDYDGKRAYSQSKLAQIIFGSELAETSRGTGDGEQPPPLHLHANQDGRAGGPTSTLDEGVAGHACAGRRPRAPRHHRPLLNGTRESDADHRPTAPRRWPPAARDLRAALRPVARTFRRSFRLKP